MIKIHAFLSKDGMTVSAAGHAGMGPQGSDIVCAGVSALLYGFAAYLENVVPGGAEALSRLEYSEGDGALRLETRGLEGADLRGWEVVSRGLRLIEETYPSCVRLSDEILRETSCV